MLEHHEAEKKNLKYTPVRSFVDSSFFSKLADLKLNVYKLDTNRQPIVAKSTNPLELTRFNDQPTLNLDYDSFESAENVDGKSITWNGFIYNFNSIEDFKNVNKQDFLKELGTEVFNKVLRGAKESRNYVNLNFISLISFSDLKKYKFFYWFAFPSLSSTWVVLNSDREGLSSFESMIERDLKESSSFCQFFQILDGNIIKGPCEFNDSGTFVFIDTCLTESELPSAQLKNFLFLLAAKSFKIIDLIVFRIKSSFRLKLKYVGDEIKPGYVPKVLGWERTSSGKLGAKMADLGSLIDPHLLARQAVDLNLKLMKWRIAPKLDLELISSQKVLLLGAGTLGSYVARTLMGWGVKHITFVDSGRVSFSNPVRQPLFTFENCYSDEGKGVFKAKQAAEALKTIFPGVKSEGYVLEVPMIGHFVDESKVISNYDTLCRLFDEHDAVFLLMDSRESRWLPTVLASSMNKVLINAALGFDSYLVMRHGCAALSARDLHRLGCYFCNDVVAPIDSLSDRTLDEMCTVTRPGVAPIASALAVELFISILQHPLRHLAPANSCSNFGEVPHQIRGFLHDYSQKRLSCPSFKHCSACSETVLAHYKEEGWDFIHKCLNHPKFLENVCGLERIQQEADSAADNLLGGIDYESEDEEWLK